MPYIMNVYITNANARKIVRSIDLTKAAIKGELYHKKNHILNAMFSKYEKNELLAFKKLMENPESFMSEVYVKIPKKEDTYSMIYEDRKKPAYHTNKNCKALHSSFTNYKIPASIRFRGISKKIRLIS